MSIIKQAKDLAAKMTSGRSVPTGLTEMHSYFKNNGPIKFNQHRKNGLIVAISSNFIYGSIVTSGKDTSELDKNIKDAILTSFEIPSTYAKEAGLYQTGEKEREYAIA
ncbi:hypothetical protein EOM71_02355 [Candidatus Falkowbacteria bacterium]|nr:hypothetical protein [Candidatus Falkowbacteria bacterium]